MTMTADDELPPFPHLPVSLPSKRPQADHRPVEKRPRLSIALKPRRQGRVHPRPGRIAAVATSTPTPSASEPGSARDAAEETPFGFGRSGGMPPSEYAFLTPVSHDRSPIFAGTPTSTPKLPSFLDVERFADGARHPPPRAKLRPRPRPHPRARPRPSPAGVASAERTPSIPDREDRSDLEESTASRRLFSFMTPSDVRTPEARTPRS